MSDEELIEIRNKITELEHYQSLIMGKDIGMSSVWSRFDEISNKVYELEASSASHTEKIESLDLESLMIKEVLREFFKTHIEFAKEVIDIEDMDKHYEMWRNKLKELLARLDVGSARHTEVDITNMVLKRCPCCSELLSVDANTLELRGGKTETSKTEKKEVDCDECKSWALGCELDGSRRRDCSRQNYKFFRPKKDSGGDISGVDKKDITEDNDMSSLVLPNDSKPPEPKPGEHFIMRDDRTPNNPILRALFFGGDEEYIVDWKFRYKREYYDIVKREDLQFLCDKMFDDLKFGDTTKIEKIKETYDIK